MDPYIILKVNPDDCTDESIRSRYVDLIKTYTPHSHPEKFQRIDKAYQAIKTRQERIEWDLFHQFEDTDTLLETLSDIDFELEIAPLTCEKMKRFLLGT